MNSGDSVCLIYFTMLIDNRIIAPKVALLNQICRYVCSLGRDAFIDPRKKLLLMKHNYLAINLTEESCSLCGLTGPTGTSTVVQTAKGKDENLPLNELVTYGS